MRIEIGFLICVSGCGHLSHHNERQLVRAATAIAVATAATLLSAASNSDGKTLEVEEADVPSRPLVSRNGLRQSCGGSHYLEIRCDEHEQCGYFRDDGLTVSCRDAHCHEGAPLALTKWCEDTARSELSHSGAWIRP